MKLLMMCGVGALIWGIQLLIYGFPNHILWAIAVGGLLVGFSYGLAWRN